MSDTYVECLVKAKTSPIAILFKFALIAVAVVCGIGAFLGIPFVFFGMLLAGAGAYFVNMFTDLEYEYLYVDRELVVDKVMAKSRRKQVDSYSMDRMEILAPVKSHQLDSYKNRSVKVKDYSIGQELQPDQRYAMYYEGGVKVILSPSPELIKAMKNASPRKVFTD